MPLRRWCCAAIWRETGAIAAMDALARGSYDQDKPEERVVAPKTSIEALCVAKGMRMTEQRRVIARVLADSADHPDV